MRARHLTVAAALLLLIGAGQTLGAEPTAAGLWQSLDEESHQPNAWFLIRDNGGLYEGTIVRMFMKPARTRTSSATSARTTAAASPGWDWTSSAA